MWQFLGGKILLDIKLLTICDFHYREGNLDCSLRTCQLSLLAKSCTVLGFAIQCCQVALIKLLVAIDFGAVTSIMQNPLLIFDYDQKESFS